MSKEMNSNKEFLQEMKNKVDKMMSQMFGDMVSLTGATLSELDPEQVRIFNKYMRMYNEMWDLYIDWAEYQDRMYNKQKIMQQTMCGMIENNRQVLTSIDDKLQLFMDAGDPDSIVEKAREYRRKKKEE